MPSGKVGIGWNTPALGLCWWY